MDAVHAKTLVADGWLSKVGSTTQNFSSLAANWEIDLVVEDTDFASQMEELFEDDMSKSREVHWKRSGQRQRVRPDRRVDTTDSGARAGVVGSGTGSGRPYRGLAPPPFPEGTAPLQAHEHVMAAAAAAPFRGCRCSVPFPAPHRLAADGGGRFSPGAWRPARDPIDALQPREGPAGVGCDVAKDGRYGWNEDLSPAIPDVLVAPPAEASLRLQVTDLLLGRRRDVRRGRSTRAGDVLQQIEAGWKPTRAISTRPSTANEAVTIPDVRRPDA